MKDIKIGDEFEIELGGGEIKKFKVNNVRQVNDAESEAQLFSQNPDVDSQVNLVTCPGEFNKQSGRYNDRIIISAEYI